MERDLDLERAVTFTDYKEMEEELIIDEEHVNYPILCARIFSFFLLFLIILCLALEEITKRFLFLAALICALLILVIVSTYIDPRKLFKYCLTRDTARITSNNIIANPLQQTLSTQTQMITRNSATN